MTATCCATRTVRRCATCATCHGAVRARRKAARRTTRAKRTCWQQLPVRRRYTSTLAVRYERYQSATGRSEDRLRPERRDDVLCRNADPDPHYGYDDQGNNSQDLREPL